MKWAVVAVLLSFLAPLTGSPAAKSDSDAPDRTKLGEFIPVPNPAPAPTLTLSDLSGNTADLSDFRGKLVVVNLWATWCAPCLEEMPSLERLQSRLGERIAVLKSVKTYLDPKSAVGHAFDVQGLPTSFLIDRDGKVLGKVEGAAVWDSPKMLGVLEPFLADNGIVKTSTH
jgi:thiol-disulfide isomerase/thioredoxin